MTNENAFDGVTWTDGLSLTIEGQGWAREELVLPYSRLPGRAEKDVPVAVWDLSLQSAGLTVRFRTDATSIYARWQLKDGGGETPADETATGRGGMDCYGYEGGRWIWVGVCSPWRGDSPDGCFNATPLDGKEREYKVYLPLRTEVEFLEIGVKAPARLEAACSDERKPIVIYGTSIVHGAKTTRPGMAHAAILNRRLDWPVLNLGFSGSARMEQAVSDLLSETDASLYVIDCLPNMSPEQITERVVPLAETLRHHRPETPILFVADRLFGDSGLQVQRQQVQIEKSGALKTQCERLEKMGMDRVYYLEEANYFGDDMDGTVDGSHPTDLGAYRMANVLEPVIRKIMGIQK